ncbi:MAG: c-type cytochrome domain-containing protein [Planctomycetia bacterium]
MMRLARYGGALLLVAVAMLASGLAGSAAEPPSPAEIRRQFDEARELLDDGKPVKARALVQSAAADLAALLELEKVPAGARPLIDVCKELRSDLELEGVDVAAITIPKGKPARPKPDTVAPTPRRQPARPAPGISFTQQVAPVLLTHCGGCHVSGRKGGFQMQSYAALMQAGVVQPGAANASRLVEVIETGDMPRGGGRVAPQELALLMAWISAGAPFDGPDPTSPLGAPAAVAAAPGAPAASPAAPVALKPGDVSFAFEIAPLLLKNCAGCHDDDQPEARFSMTTFARLSTGGRSGTPFVAGRAADSLLVRKIKGASGIEGQRMPSSKPPLSPEAIALVEKWIDQGARLDLLGPTSGLTEIAAAGRARSLSHADLRAARFAAAEKLWRRGLADEPPTTAPLDDVIVIGNLSKPQLDKAAEAVEKAAAGARKHLIDGEGPLLKGGVACLLFAKAYDYSNFREVILGEERPKGLTGNAGVSGDVAYGALIVPATSSETGDDDLAALAAEQIAAAAFIGRGAPPWFAQGAGRAVGMKVAPKAPVARAWKAEVSDAVARLGSPEDFFAGSAGPVAVAAIGGGFVAEIAASPAKLQALVEKIDAGAAFDAAFAEVFKAPPQAVFATWCAKQARASMGRR